MTPVLSVSNIAWPADQQQQAIDLLKSMGVTGVEIAPFNVFQTWDVSLDRIREFKARLDHAGMACPAFQGILFNVPGAHLFQSDESRSALRNHLIKIARMAGILGAQACVFGAPKVRDPGELDPDRAFDMAAEFLRTVGPIFASENSNLAFEPNAAAYACRFIRKTSEAIKLVQQVATAGIQLQIDTGTVLMEEEPPDVLSLATPYAAHAHISEPNLAPVGSSGCDHTPLARALRAGGYAGTISIEMKCTPAWRDDVRNAVAFARKVYLS